MSHQAHNLEWMQKKSPVTVVNSFCIACLKVLDFLGQFSRKYTSRGFNVVDPIFLKFIGISSSNFQQICNEM